MKCEKREYKANEKKVETFSDLMTQFCVSDL